MKNHRRFPRIPCSLSGFMMDMEDDVSIAPLDVLIETQALEVSQRGLKIKSSFGIRVGAFVAILLFHKGKKSMCFCQVRWRKREKKQFVYGLYFMEWSHLDPELGKLIRQSEPVWNLFHMPAFVQRLSPQSFHHA